MRRHAHRLLASLCAALVVGTTAFAGDAAPPAAPTVQEAADAVLAARRGGDAAKGKGLAARDDPDPWLVADELIARGERDAALEFAKAAPRTAVERLPEYVAARRGAADGSSARAALATALAALAADHPDEALSSIERTESPGDSLLAARLAHTRGRALRDLDRLEESVAAFGRAGEAARGSGWWAMRRDAAHEAGRSAELRSDFATAAARYAEKREICTAMGDRFGAAGARNAIGNVHLALGRFQEARADYEGALEEREAIGDRVGVAGTLVNLGNLHQDLGDHAQARAYLERGLAEARAVGKRQWAANALNGLGIVFLSTGDYPAAREKLEQALAEKEALNDRRGLASTLSNLGNVQVALGSYAEALALYERAIESDRARGDRRGAAATLVNIGGVHYRRGDLSRALTAYERALEEVRAIGDRPREIRVLGNLSATRLQLGDFPQAIELAEAALKEAEDLADASGVADGLDRLGTLYAGLGDMDKALAYSRRALAQAEALGEKETAIGIRLSIAEMQVSRDDFSSALPALEKSLAEADELGLRRQAAGARSILGSVWLGRGDDARARGYLEKALEALEALGDRRGVAHVLCNLGLARVHLGEREQGTALIDHAVREARRLRYPGATADYLRVLAGVQFEAGDPRAALASANAGLVEVERELGGLDEETSSTLRASHAGLFVVGARAAVALDEAPALLTILESGRAGALLETLGGRERLRFDEIPAPLREAEEHAEAAEALARKALDRALDGEGRDAIQRATAALDEARGRVGEAIARIQREAKRQAGLLYPRAATLEEVEGRLLPGEALVLYTLPGPSAAALVVTHGAHRIVRLGKILDIEAAGESLGVPAASNDPKAALDRLRRLLVEPLALDPKVEVVLVSADALCVLPWGALFDRPVALTPSGTTHVLLRDEQRARGEGVLALGDPAYGGTSEGGRAVYFRGRPLRALPGTRREATGVGESLLLGAEANEEALAKRLAERKRWRAVHFACHGLIDPQRALLSSLALSRSEHSDGFLTAAEVLRMRIPADLAVLSACETGTGRVEHGEGVLGLMRAFMYAGTPRVLCSLWKVDDEATLALMTKFYELWNPADRAKALPAAAALRAAQARVRDDSAHPQWKHPYYWAAWVLWGLPE